MSPDARVRFEQFHGLPFPPLAQRDAWILILMLARPELRYYEAMKEWQHRASEPPEKQIMETGGGRYGEYCEMFMRSLPGTNAVLLLIANDQTGPGFSISVANTEEGFKAYFSIPAVLREVASQVEADIKKRVEAAEEERKKIEEAEKAKQADPNKPEDPFRDLLEMEILEQKQEEEGRDKP